ncbi:MAG: ribonuclease Z [Candidatus Aenigmarchaeota archaeon]|nr:ribonuclease Z [Candidatus Aenigmarchaeota archaeon]
MLRITFLGTSSSVPTRKRNHPAIVMEYYSKRNDILLFDCGEGTQLQLMKAGISFMQITKIFITHWHADHFAGLLPMLATMNMEKRKKPLKIFAPFAEKHLYHMKALYHYKPLFEISAIDVEVKDEPVKIFENDEYEIHAIKVKHTVPSVAYAFKEKDHWSIDVSILKKMGLRRGKWLEALKKEGEYEINGKKIRIENVATLKRGLKVVYTGDTEKTENVVKLAKDADILIHDSTYVHEDKEPARGHSSAREAAEIAKEANVKLLVLTHLSRRYQTKEDIEKLLKDAKQVFENVIVAEDFMQITIKTGEEPKITKLKI